MDRREEFFSHPVTQILVKFATLLAPFGGPHLVMDVLRPLIGKPAAVILACAPVILMYLGADALAEPDTSRWRNKLVRFGLGGAVLLAVMNAYALWRIVVPGDVPLRGLMIGGLVIGSLAIVAYTILARRALRVVPPPIYTAP